MKIVRKYTTTVIRLLAGLIWIPFWIVMSGTVCIEWHGFGVDSTGAVYVGKTEEIAIYVEGQHVDAIDVPRFRSYRMTVENDTIVIATSQYVYLYDVEGTELSCTKDQGGSIHSGMKDNMTCYRAVDGTQYVATTALRHQIIRDDGAIVYEMHWWDCFVKVWFIISIISFATTIIIQVSDSRTEKH